MKKKWWLLLTALLLLGSILSWTAFQRAHTFTLSGSEEKKKRADTALVPNRKGQR